MKIEKNRIELLNEFYSAPLESLFPQQTLCAVLDCSTSLAERNRWAGLGVHFVKVGKAVRYFKKDILAYLEKCGIQPSTSQSGVKSENK